MLRQIIRPEGSRVNSALSPAAKFGNLVFTSGAVGTDPVTGALVGTDIESQTRQTMENLDRILHAAGSSLDQALKVTVFLVNLSDRAAFSDVYIQFFSAEPPPRSCVAVADLGANVLVEVEVVAATS
ncbi:MAG: Rid family detoxifying hydrolase [Thermomicrobiales bacterium]|nr:Rid family detoxifying hydrolase [Thermomicrobiales bacterium]MCO5225937.1 Rid family detoxifying hydrolase [Thermomicrobiales bacterium]MCO5227700.1 Rid family detoxifying hydrolase [Thermomicrobiales bacterium]